MCRKTGSKIHGKKEIKKLETGIEVTHIFQDLSKSLLVCHNMFLDLIYPMRQFTGHLPEDLDYVLDTKHLCTKGALKEVVGSSVLPHIILEACRSSLFQLPKIESLGDQKYSLDDSKEHESGYHSFITEVCFLALTNHLGIFPKDFNANCKKLKSFKKQNFRARPDQYCCNLTGPDEKPSREHVFHSRSNGLMKLSLIWPCNNEYTQSVMKSIGKYPGVTVVPYAEYEDAQSPHEDRKRKLPESSSQESGEKAVKAKSTKRLRFFQRVQIGDVIY
ncbi:PARN [Sergentomyia squamirostris]